MTSEAHAAVATDRPARYGKQLVAHLGRRNGGEWSADAESGWIDLGAGRATVAAGDGLLDLHLSAPADELARLQDVIGSHLVRFGERDELSVEWTKAI
jgi:hypothetical protein